MGRCGGMFGCCAAIRPRYKKLVDHIYPPNPQDGLVKDNMVKLTFYAMNHPDKLDRIGEYLQQQLYRDVHRKRFGYVEISMDAFDQLLVSCHDNLNLFVESFFHMIQKLLESQEPSLQLRAAQSFEEYAKIQEDTPQYHRRYDFFIEKFASMCYFNNNDVNVRKELRTSGIMGLQGVVRKTGWDSFGDNIWQPVHMDKIVPALLFNMEGKMESIQGSKNSDTRDGSNGEARMEKHPSELAEICLRELSSRATSGKIDNIIKPLLTHLDHHNLWVENEFAVQTFKLIIYSIQAPYSVTVIKMIIAHLSDSPISSHNVKARIGIADVLSRIIPIAAGECIGPSVIDIINSLLEQTTNSRTEADRHSKARWNDIEISSQYSNEEETYRDTLIHALGEYSNHLPDYQKIESMMFILNKIPGIDRLEDLEKLQSEKEIRLQHLLLKSLLKVGTKYTAIHYSTTFSLNSFLVRLMRLSVSYDCEIRLTVQKILHTLLDRKNNASCLKNAGIDAGVLKLSNMKISRQDVNFWKKAGNEIILSIQENCEFSSNNLNNIESLYTTMMLLLIEIRHDDVIIDTLRILFHVQNFCADAQNELSSNQICQLHGLVASLMVAAASCIPPLQEHIMSVVEKRSSSSSYLLPPLKASYSISGSDLTDISEEFLFNKDTVIQVLKEANMEFRRLTTVIPSLLRKPSSIRRDSKSITDINAISVDVDSAASSPALPRRPLAEVVTFESLKKALSETTYELRHKEKMERRKEIYDAFQNDSFEALLVRTQRPTVLQDTLTEIFSRLPPCYPQNPLVSSPPSAIPQATYAGHPIGGCSPALNLASYYSPYKLPYPDIIY